MFALNNSIGRDAETIFEGCGQSLTLQKPQFGQVFRGQYDWNEVAVSTLPHAEIGGRGNSGKDASLSSADEFTLPAGLRRLSPDRGLVLVSLRSRSNESIRWPKIQ
jgi:hypothetical protein